MVAALPLNSGIVTAVPLTTGASTNIDVECSRRDRLVVQADLTGAANGDLTVTVTPFGADGASLGVAPLTAAVSGGPSFAGGRVTFYGQYDVRGIDKVRVNIRNNNAGSQTLTRASWRTTGSEE